MSSIQTLRAILVAGAALAAVVGLFTGRYGVAATMVLAVAVHGGFTLYLRRRLPPAPSPAGAVTTPPADPVA